MTGHRDRRGDGRTGHALDATHAQQRRRHRGAGVAGRDHGGGLAVAHRLGGPHERGVLHPPHARAGVGAHRDHLGGRDHLEVAGERAEHLGLARRARPGRRARPRRGARRRRSPQAPCPHPSRRAATGSSIGRVPSRTSSSGISRRRWPGGRRTSRSSRRRRAGSLVAPQRGHTLRAGVSSFQALARRLRLFALEVFFLGTAIGDPHLENGSCRGEGIEIPALQHSRETLAAGSPDRKTGRAAVSPGRSASASRAAQRGSRAGSSSARARRPRRSAGKASGAGPAQSGRHSGARGRCRSAASRTTGSRSTSSPSIG